MCLEVLRALYREDRPFHVHVYRKIRKRLQERKDQDVLSEVMDELDEQAHQRNLQRNAQILMDPGIMDENGSDELLNLDSLMAMSPLYNGVDLVGRASRQLFLSFVKKQPSVYNIFFHNVEKDRYEDRIDSSWFDFDRFASVYTCHAITKCKDHYLIHTMLDEDKTDELVADYFASPDWKKIGESIIINSQMVGSSR